MTPHAGKTIGEYQLVHEISETEHWGHFKAFQPGMDRYVRFTVLKPDLAKDPAAVQQFLQSSEAVAKMKHVNILPVFDYGQQRDLVYRVSALQETGTVKENIAWYQEVSSALALIDQVAAGLEYLYAQGYIHGNLTSENTFLDEQRRPQLSGFGMTQPASSQPDPYESPEKRRGDVVDKRSDVYSMGCLLYEMLIGTPPPVGMIVNPSAKRPDLPEAVDRVVLKAMAQNPDQRFQSPVEFRDALRTAVQEGTAPAAPPPAAPPVSQTVEVQAAKGTNWTAIVLGLLLVIALAAVAFLVIPPLLGDDDAAVVDPTEPVVEQPTEAPEEPAPTEPPQEPPEEAPPPDEPITLPVEERPEICASLGFGAGIAVLGLTLSYPGRKRRK